MCPSFRFQHYQTVCVDHARRGRHGCPDLPRGISMEDTGDSSSSDVDDGALMHTMFKYPRFPKILSSVV